jgi:hypothetical protein
MATVSTESPSAKEPAEDGLSLGSESSPPAELDTEPVPSIVGGCWSLVHAAHNRASATTAGQVPAAIRRERLNEVGVALSL